MENKKNIDNFFLLILPIVLIGVYVGYSTLLICVGLIILRLFTTDRATGGFYLVLFGGTLGGIIRATYPSIPIYGIMLEFIGICLLLKDIRYFLKRNSKGFGYLILVILIFICTYIYGPHTEYATSKLFGIIKNGILLYLGYCVFERSCRINEECIAQLLIFSSTALVIFICSFYNFPIGGIFDYEWFRSRCVAWAYHNNEHLLVGYQSVGMYAAYAAALILSMKKLNVKKAVFYVILCSQIIMTSGCRQALLAIIMIVFLRFYYFQNSGINKTNRRGWLKFIAIGFIVVVYLVVKNSDIGTLSKTVENGDTGRFAIFIDAILMFIANPVFGVGLGGYPVHSALIESVYPHNFLLEILCETGLFGLFSISIVVIIFARKNHVNLKYITASGCYLFLFMIALVIRVMVSGDFTESIELFSALFACSQSKKYLFKRNDKLFDNNTVSRQVRFS